mmetsp:Transcript_13694/g.39265  ORF Transcript_13694/g.39265 Transcript_13694/m.39265 type:complete len:203 (+) Transcript_13694:776-1384(+)
MRDATPTSRDWPSWTNTFERWRWWKMGVEVMKMRTLHPTTSGNFHPRPHRIPLPTTPFCTFTPSWPRPPPMANGATPPPPPTQPRPPPSCAGWRVGTTAPTARRSCPTPSVTPPSCTPTPTSGMRGRPNGYWTTWSASDKIPSGPIGSRPTLSATIPPSTVGPSPRRTMLPTGRKICFGGWKGWRGTVPTEGFGPISLRTVP